MGAYGTSSYGVAPYGVTPATATYLAISYAYAVGDRTVRVVLTTQPLESTGLVTGDALNPNTWQVTRGDTGAALTVLGVVPIDEYTFDLSTLETLPPWGIACTVAAPDLLDTFGAPITTPYSATFQGVQSTQASTYTQQIGTRRLATTDLANPQALSGATLGVAGTLQIAPSGDYRTVTGNELLRKLIYRRLMTGLGEFFHLPTYGAGLAVKQPVPASSLPGLRSLIDRQIRQEPEVADLAVQVFLDGGNSLLQVDLWVTTRTGDTVGMAFNFPGASQ